jgi:hypothetical protein
VPHPSSPFFSRAFGLALTADRPVPGLICLTDAVPADTRIWLDAEAMLPTIRRLPADLWYASEETEMSGVRVWKISGGEYYRLLYSDGTEFFVQGSGTDVWAAWPGSSTIDDTATYLLGPVLAFVLGLRGITCLHGSVVAIADRAVVFAGPSASGKSTLAAAFARLGHTVLSDDIAVLAERDGVLYVDPAHPQIRLWSDSVELLFGAADALPCLTANWDKRGLDLIESGYSFAERPLPLAAVYILDERSTPVEPRIDSIKGRELLRTLLANTYVGYMLDVSMRSQDFATLSRLAAAVPVRRLHISGDPRQVCVDIIEDCEALGCTASPITGR